MTKLIKPRQAMILAAGEGTRMRPLTLTTPKPLLVVGGKPLIVWHIERLVALGVQKIVVNVRYLADKLIQFFDNHDFDVEILLSQESCFDEPIETAAGIKVALERQLLWREPFFLINGDVWTNMSLMHLGLPTNQNKQMLAYLVLVDNPSHHPKGDFLLCRQAGVNVGQVLPKDWQDKPNCVQIFDGKQSDVLTFSGISVLSPQLFDTLVYGKPCRLAPVLLSAMAQGQVLGVWQKCDEQIWVDVGTPERLDMLNAYLADGVSSS